MHAGHRIQRTIGAFMTLAFLPAFFNVSFASDPVYLRSHQGRSTVNSLNLRWVNGARGSKPNDAVLGTLELYSGPSTVSEAEEEDMAPSLEHEDTFICRALHQQSFWLPGHLNASSSVCTVSLDATVYAYDTYQLLQNEGGGTKLSWVHWDRTSGPLPLQRAIDVDGTGNYYVARREGTSPEEEKLYEHTGIGKLDLRERSNHVAVADTRTPNDGPYRLRNRRRNPNIVPGEAERIYISGKVLVAADPKSYEMSVVEVGREPREVRSHSVVLATGKLVNNGSSLDEDEPPMVNCVLSYDAQYTINWAQGKGMVLGLPVNILTQGEDVQQVMQGRAANNDQMSWGQTLSWKLHEEKMVEEKLPSGTAANVSLVANKTVTETLCIANVTTFYGDGTSSSRNISVMRKMEKPEHLQVEVGPAYYLGNGTMATTPSPVETITTTTVVSATSAVHEEHPYATDGTSYQHSTPISTGTGNKSFKNATDKRYNNTRGPEGSSQSNSNRYTSTPTIPNVTERVGKKFEYETVTDAQIHKKVASAASQTLSKFWGTIPPAIYGPIVYCIARRRLLGV